MALVAYGGQSSVDPRRDAHRQIRDPATWSPQDDLPPPQAPLSWGEALLEVAGTVEGLPPDYAEYHDHYLHGLPRR